MRNDFHQPAYSPEGEYLSDYEGTWTPIKFWCDFWWDVAHLNVQGESYLDVGCAEGLYPLRFSQRGGFSDGVNPNWRVDDQTPDWELSQNDTCIALRAMYPKDRFDIRVGSFDVNGRLNPNCHAYDYVSCMNTLEYVKTPKECVETLFRVSTEQVMIGTDISHGATKEYTDGSWGPLLRHLSLADLRSWSPWPHIVRTYTYLNQPQGIMIARKDGNFAGIPEIAPVFKLGDKMPTQVRWENSK